MRISVVVIVFNLDAYIGNAIDSVLSQTKKPDEVIVVDDCSTDHSPEKIKAYGDKVRYLRMPKNSGALLAALHGVKSANGDVICMLDGDDYWAANKLEVVEREFEANPDLMLLSHYHERVDENGAGLGIRDETHRNIAHICRIAQSAEHFSDLLRETVLDQSGYWLGSAYTFRSNLLDVAKFEDQIGDFRGLKEAYLDLIIAPFLVLTNPTKAIGYTSDTKFFYRIHDKASMAGNISTERAIQSVLKGRKINELIYLILRENHASLVHLKRLELILQEYDFLSALYSGDFGKAARLYLRLARRLWSWRKLSKETKRMLAVRILGVEKFLRLKNRT